MPIVVDHRAPAATIAGAANIAGQGVFNERRRQEQLALAELAQRDAAQRRAIAASQQQQQFAAMQGERERLDRMRMAGWQAALQQQGILRGRQWQLEDRDAARGFMLEDREAAGAEWDRREEDRFGREWELGAIDAAEKGVGAGLADLIKAKDRITPEGMNILGKLTGKWRAIQGSRATVPPEEYGKLVNQFAQDLDASGVQDHVKPPPTIEEEIAKRVKPGPDGNSYILQPNGEIRPFAPPKQETPEQKSEAAWQKFRDSYIGKTRKVVTGRDRYGDPIEEDRPYTAQQIVELWETGQEADRLMREKLGGPAPAQPGISDTLSQFKPDPMGQPAREDGQGQPLAVQAPPQPPPLTREQANQTLGQLIKEAVKKKPGWLTRLALWRGYGVNSPEVQFDQEQFGAILKQVHNDDIRDWAADKKVPAPMRQMIEAEIATRPPEGFDFPYGQRNRKPLPVLTEGELSGAEHTQKKLPQPGEMFIDAGSGQVYVRLPNGRYKLVPPDLL